jgi:hypothetical protein
MKEVTPMIAVAKQPRRPLTAEATELFESFIPTIQHHARLAFHILRPQERREAVAEALAYAFFAFRRLAERGKLDVAHASALARFGVARVRSGRSIAKQPRLHDVFSFVAQGQAGFSLQSLQSGRANVWTEMLVDNTTTPVANAAAFRLDFGDWLKALKRRDRKLAEYLAMGNSPSATAKRFRLSRPRVSQLRAELEASWRDFQDEKPKAAPTASQRGCSAAVA